MKKTKLRRRSKSKYYIDKADRAVQDFYRALHLKCEVCGAPAELVHHFIEKSKSNYLRFNGINLIPICRKCHFKHHNAGDATIHAKIIQKRGQEWLNKIIELSRIKRSPFSNKELQEITKIYKNMKLLINEINKKAIIEFNHDDFFIVKSDDEAKGDYALAWRIDRSDKGKDPDVGMPIIYLLEEEAKKLKSILDGVNLPADFYD